MSLDGELRTFVEAITSQKAQAVNWIRTGTKDLSSFASFDMVTLPAELCELWSMIDGMSVPDDTLMQYTWLDGTFCYFCVEEAAHDYEVSLGLWEQDQYLKDYWPQAFVPIGTPGDGSRLLVNCLASSPTYGSVYELFHGEGISRISESLSQYFKTLNACLANGALTVTHDGEVAVDFDAFYNIGRQMNPGCDHFD